MLCLPCRDGREAPDAAAGGGKPLRPRKSATAAAALAPEEVLARYDAGPRDGVFTDGSASPNPGPGGWAAVRVEGDAVVEARRGAAGHTTNNRMELTALIEAFRMLPENAEATVYSDSQLCVRTVNEWAPRWEAAGWKRKTGPIENLDLVRELVTLARERPAVRLEWVPGHAGWRWNEYADAVANAARESGRSREPV
jgi:ribonuclease HI